MSWEDLSAVPDPQWLIESILIEGSFNLLFGAPGVGKSFVALSIALSIAHGIPWLTKDAIQGDVVYIAAEGLLGFKDRVPAFINHYELTGKGIVPDVTREGRRVYETALLLSRGDRRIIKPVANACYFPANKTEALHVSEKPVAVLKHFFEMFVDEETMLLDPTCGSGSAIRAASIMGAKRALGLELNPDFAKDAQNELKQMNFLNNILP